MEHGCEMYFKSVVRCIALVVFSLLMAVCVDFQRSVLEARSAVWSDAAATAEQQEKHHKILAVRRRRTSDELKFLFHVLFAMCGY